MADSTDKNPNSERSISAAHGRPPISPFTNPISPLHSRAEFWTGSAEGTPTPSDYSPGSDYYDQFGTFDGDLSAFEEHDISGNKRELIFVKELVSFQDKGTEGIEIEAHQDIPETHQASTGELQSAPRTSPSPSTGTLQQSADRDMFARDSPSCDGDAPFSGLEISMKEFYTSIAMEEEFRSNIAQMGATSSVAESEEPSGVRHVINSRSSRNCERRFGSRQHNTAQDSHRSNTSNSSHRKYMLGCESYHDLTDSCAGTHCGGTKQEQKHRGMSQCEIKVQSSTPMGNHEETAGQLGGDAELEESVIISDLPGDVMHCHGEGEQRNSVEGLVNENVAGSLSSSDNDSCVNPQAIVREDSQETHQITQCSNDSRGISNASCSGNSFLAPLCNRAECNTKSSFQDLLAEMLSEFEVFPATGDQKTNVVSSNEANKTPKKCTSGKESSRASTVEEETCLLYTSESNAEENFVLSVGEELPKTDVDSSFSSCGSDDSDSSDSSTSSDNNGGHNNTPIAEKNSTVKIPTIKVSEEVEKPGTDQHEGCHGYVPSQKDDFFDTKVEVGTSHEQDSSLTEEKNTQAPPTVRHDKSTAKTECESSSLEGSGRPDVLIVDTTRPVTTDHDKSTRVVKSRKAKSDTQRSAGACDTDDAASLELLVFSRGTSSQFSYEEEGEEEYGDHQSDRNCPWTPPLGYDVRRRHPDVYETMVFPEFHPSMGFDQYLENINLQLSGDGPPCLLDLHRYIIESNHYSSQGGGGATLEQLSEDDEEPQERAKVKTRPQEKVAKDKEERSNVRKGANEMPARFTKMTSKRSEYTRKKPYRLPPLPTETRAKCATAHRHGKPAEQHRDKRVGFRSLNVYNKVAKVDFPSEVIHLKKTSPSKKSGVGNIDDVDMPLTTTVSCETERLCEDRKPRFVPLHADACISDGKLSITVKGSSNVFASSLHKESGGGGMRELPLNLNILVKDDSLKSSANRKMKRGGVKKKRPLKPSHPFERAKQQAAKGPMPSDRYTDTDRNIIQKRAACLPFDTKLPSISTSAASRDPERKHVRR